MSIAERAATRPEGSYVVSLLDQGVAAAAQKVGEEGVEAALAAVGESDERLVEELADLWFHCYVLLAARGLDPERVEEELRRRHAARLTCASAPEPLVDRRRLPRQMWPADRYDPSATLEHLAAGEIQRRLAGEIAEEPGKLVRPEGVDHPLDS